jgi:hypothetical protein
LAAPPCFGQHCHIRRGNESDKPATMLFVLGGACRGQLSAVPRLRNGSKPYSTPFDDDKDPFWEAKESVRT